MATMSLTTTASLDEPPLKFDRLSFTPPTLHLSSTKVCPSTAPSSPAATSSNDSSFPFVAALPKSATISNSSGNLPLNGNRNRSQTSVVQLRLQTNVVTFHQTLLQQQHQSRSSLNQGQTFVYPIHTHTRLNSYSHSQTDGTTGSDIRTSSSQFNLGGYQGHKKTQSTQLAGKLEDIMSSTLLMGPLSATAETATTMGETTNGSDAAQLQEELFSLEHQPVEEMVCCSEYVYTAPCEHHPSKGQTDYLVNDMFPKLENDLSTIEFGIRIADFMPLAFKTVPVAGLAEKELELLQGLSDLPYVIQLQDSFVNDNGDTVLVLPMLKKFDYQAVNKNLCSVRKTVRQILTGLAAIHARNIVHLDINPSNLMVTHAKRDLVIIDFGLSLTVERDPKMLGDASRPQVSACGTSGYIAPEILQPHCYEAHDPTLADLYSLGVVLGQMLEPYIPDCDLHYFGSKYLGVENTNQAVASLQEFKDQGASCYPCGLIQAADLLQTMLQENPRDRVSAQTLLDTHPFLAKHAGSSASSSTLELSEWSCRVQEIKYQRYLYRQQDECEVYRFR